MSLSDLRLTLPSDQRLHGVALACLCLVLGAVAPLAQAQTAESAPVTPAGAAAPEGSPAVRTLIGQARQWQQLGRADLATRAWLKLLTVDPRQPDALHGLATLSLDASRFDEATGYLNRLRAVQPAHPDLARLTQLAQSQTPPRRLITEARQYAKAGQTEAAARSYRQALGQQQPVPEEFALEYLQTLGGTREGWDEARRGLEAIVQAQPGQSGPALAYARHLSYREGTRRDAIKRLAALSEQAGASAAVRDDARLSWRQALIWLDARPADAPLYQQYLASVGDDAEVRGHLDESRKAAPRGAGSSYPAALRQAFALLNAGDTLAAGERFEAQLRQHPADADSLAGLGLVRLKQERFAEAVDLLGRAAGASRDGRWKPALRGARHWRAVHESQTARVAGDADRALLLARQAVEVDPKEPEGQVLLGDLQAERGQWPAAQAAYRDALRAEARHPRASLGLVTALGAAGQTEQAEAQIRQLDPAVLARLGGPDALQAAILRQQADLAQQRGDLAGAQALLEQAVALAPASPWVRLSLGQLLVRQGRPEAARAQLEAFVIPASAAAEPLQARAQLQSELKDWTGALQTLDRIPEAERSADAARLQRRVALHAQAAEAVDAGRAGQMARAQALLREAEQVAGQDPDLIGAVANARFELGDEAGAGQLIRTTLAAQPDAGPSLRLRHAALLLQTQQDAELSGVLRQLSAQPMTAAQRRDFDELRLGQALRQADTLRERSNLADAWEALDPLLQERPQEPRLLKSLARLYGAAGDHPQARSLYEDVLQRQPDDVEAWLGLSATADAEKDYGPARQALDEAQRIAPASPAVLAQYARHFRAQGQYRQAAEYLRSAMAAEQPRSRSAATAAGAVGGGNPFAGRSAAMPARAATAPRLPAWEPRLAQAGGDGVALDDTPLARSARWRRLPGGVAVALADDRKPAPKLAQAAARGAPAFQPPRPAWARGAEADQPDQPESRAWSPQAGAADRRRSPMGTSPRIRKTLADELAEVQAERNRDRGRLEAGGVFRSRSGEAGLGRLNVMQTPVEGYLGLEDIGELSLRVTPTLLDAGRVDTNVGARSRSGTLGLDAAAAAQPGDQSDAGVALNLGINTTHWSADIGSTPLGFAVVDAVGGVRYQEQIGSALTLALEASRRAVTDSLLSWAGTTDARTGSTWGGVRASGARAQLTWERDDTGLYGYGGAYALNGKNVQDNTRVEAGVGSYWRSRRTTDDQLELGLNLGYQHHERNLSGFTWGHGGYFSPQHLVALTVPASWTARSGRLTWGLQGAAGIQAYREDAAPFYPTDGAAQSALVALAAQQKVPEAVYSAKTESGVTYKLGAALEYQLTPQLDVGTRLGVDHATQYRQSYGSVYLRFSLEPRLWSWLPLRAPSGPGER